MKKNTAGYEQKNLHCVYKGGSNLSLYISTASDMDLVRQLLERSAFGVCSYLGEKMGITSSRVRVYFIYISLITMGSPVIFYLFTAFWLNIRSYLKKGKSLIWH